METAFESKLLKMETAFAIQLEELRNEIKELKEGFRNLWFCPIPGKLEIYFIIANKNFI